MTEQERGELHEAMTRHGICVLMPTYNNAGTLGRVIDDILLCTPALIVVNDGSSDATPEILEGYGDRIEVMSYAKNRGKGGALKEGFMYARSRGFRYAITIDSDGQHYADDIPAFVEAIIHNPGALIVGKRDLTGVDINGKSSFANKFSNFWFRVQTGINLRDTQTGYRAYPLDRLYGLGLLTSRYEAELELLVFAAWNNVRIVELPIKVYYPPQSERVTHFRPAKDFTRISVLNTVLCFGAVLYGLPVKMFRRMTSREIKERDFKPFTHKGGKRRDAAVTLGRLVRSIYGLSFFLFWTIFVFYPYLFVSFRLGKPTEKKRLKLHKRLQKKCRYIASHFPGAETEYRGTDETDAGKPRMIICNHQSLLDLPVIIATQVKIIFLTTDWVWKNPIIGSLVHNAEFLPVSEGVESLLPKLKDLIQRGYSIVVFPEGTRSTNGKIGRFHQGAFHLADALGVEIQPMVLHGADHYLSKTDFMFRRGRITLEVLPRLQESEGLTMLKRASMYRRYITDAYGALEAEKERAEYYKPLVLYKYAYRGRKVVKECKRILKTADMSLIDNFKGKSVRIHNSGIGVYALLFALVNKDVEVYATEEDSRLHRIAQQTAGIPANLHYINPSWKVSDASYGSVDAEIVL